MSSQLVRPAISAVAQRTLGRLIAAPAAPAAQRPLHTARTPARCTNTYHGDGKTKVNILNAELELGLMINSYSQTGFRLNNELRVVGPMAIFPRSVLSWNVGSAADIDEHTLALFCVLEPKIDVLVLGLGDTNVTPAVAKRIISFTQRHRINVEILTTESACATFNFLNAEQRMVAGAFIPPQTLRVNENDLMAAQRRNNQLFEVDPY